MRANFTIDPRPLQNGFIAAIADQTYTGAALTPSLTVTYNGMTLEVGEDYAAEYAGNTDATQKSGAQASVVIGGVGNYAGSAEASFTHPPARAARRLYRRHRRPDVHGRGADPFPHRPLQRHDARSRRGLCRGVRGATSTRRKRAARRRPSSSRASGNYAGSASAAFTILPRARCKTALSQTSPIRRTPAQS